MEALAVPGPEAATQGVSGSSATPRRIGATYNPNHKETMMDELRKLIASWRDLATSWREDSLPMNAAYVAQGLADQLERALEGVDEPEPDTGKLKELANLVQVMRAAQVAYFRYRNEPDLQESKRLEAAVDRMVANILDRQARLFDDEEDEA